MRRVVYVLLVTQILDNEIRTSIGPVYWDRIDAHRASKNSPFIDMGITVQVVEREIRGEQPEMRTAGSES